MFTGIIDACGRVNAIKKMSSSMQLTIECPYQDVQIGESIAVNGVCLTVTDIQAKQLFFDVSPETLAVTTLGQLVVPQKVNLERALLPTTRIGGHYVYGHVQSTAKVAVLEKKGDFTQLVLEDFAKQSALFLLPKGSITVDGVSLTINFCVKDRIEIMLVPHTLAVTTLNDLVVEQRVNIEFDYLTQIVAHQLALSREIRSEVIK